MTRFRNILIVLLGLLAVVAGVVGVLLLIEGLEMARDFHREGLLTIEHVNRDLIVLGGTISHVEHATREAEAASKEQRAYWAAISKQTNRDLADLDHSIVALGRAADAASPAVAGVQRDLGAVSVQSAATVKQVGDTIAALQPAVQALTETATNAARLTSDPALAATLQHVSAATDQMAGVATDTHAMTTKLDQALGKALTPRGKLSAILHGILGGTLTAAQLVYYLSH